MASASGFWNRVSLPALTWLSVIVLITTSMLGTYFYLIPLGRGGLIAGRIAEREEHTRIAADGRCEVLTRAQYPYAGVTPLETLRIRTDRPLQDPVWREAGLGLLTQSVARDGEAWVYTVHMPQAIFRGETVDLRSSARVSGFAVPSETERQSDRETESQAQAPSAKRGDSRGTYTSAAGWYDERRPALTINPAWPGPLKRTVTLPPHARVESVSPKPLHQWGDLEGNSFLAFETAAGAAPEDIRITYRLPAATRPAE